jgi:hypothetical protein
MMVVDMESKYRLQGAGRGPDKAGQEQRVPGLAEDHSWRLRWRLLRSQGTTPGKFEMAIPLIRSLVQAIAGSLIWQVMC